MLSFNDQNQFINEIARNKKAKISDSHNLVVAEFLVRYRRTYALNNT